MSLEEKKEKKTQAVRKPPTSKQSDRFKNLEQKMLEIVGDEYWDWLERKYEEEIVDYTIGYKR